MKMVLLSVQDLTIHYKVASGWVRAVENVSIDVDSKETLGLVGESGSGKTTLAYAITQLLPKNAYVKGGKIIYQGKDLLKLSMKDDGTLDIFNEEIRKIRWKDISMIFQAALNAFNPVYKVGDQIIEAIMAHKDIEYEDARKEVERLYEFVGIPKDRIDNYPHEYSGGMKQRAMIAMALALSPRLVLADEPTTALDVITQDRILLEIQNLQKETGISMILITHDVSVVAEVSNKVAVMYAGKIVEKGSTVEVFKHYAHPYTEGLMASFPTIVGEKRRLASIPGSPPDLVNPPKGCRFHPRCPYAKDICMEQEPPLIEISPGHFTACHFARELYGGK
ncbi:MAG: ABC transporter ATP-binding protein [Thermoplasmata archaeon]|nr:ATP-binding cassette domain-containing protein [Euryarchaeota archaeon]MVT35386.1 ATP-binding cassette domain-containing protein [Euryarchaeota archaeon]